MWRLSKGGKKPRTYYLGQTTTAKQKIVLVFFSLITLLLLLESILRISGFIYRSYRIKNEAQNLADNGAVRILCLGDSFTFGVGAPKGYSYPEQLERMLSRNSSNLKFVVYNSAIPGGNSSQLLKRIDSLLQKFNPHVAIIMIGCNNEWVPRESNYFLFSSDKGFKAHMYKLDSFLSNLRSYNLLKSIISKLKYKLKKDSLKDDKAIIVKSPAVANSKEFEELIESGNDYYENRKVNLAEEAFQKAIALNPNDERGHLGLARVYIHCKDPEDKTELGLEELNEALRINPNNLQALTDLWQVYYRLGRNEQALKVIEKYVRLHPEDEDNLSYFLNRGLPNLNDKEAFKRLLRYDLENTIRKIRAKKVKVILQGYGMLYPNNKVLKELAEELKLPFVDNELVFSELISKDGF